MGHTANGVSLWCEGGVVYSTVSGIYIELVVGPIFLSPSITPTTNCDITESPVKMLSILRKARLKDKEMRILMLWVSPSDMLQLTNTFTNNHRYRGLDNAGKTTIVKQIMNEDVTTVSPTLGFIIKTIDFQGYDYLYLNSIIY